jgi:hypothetical protein
MVKNRYNSFLKNWRHKSCKKQAAEDLTSKILGTLRRKLQKEEQVKSRQGAEEIMKEEVSVEMRAGFGESRVEMGLEGVDISMAKVEEMEEGVEGELDEYNNLYIQQEEPRNASACDSNYLHLMMARTAKETEKEDKRTRDEEDEEYLPQLELFLGDCLAEGDQLEDNLGKREQPG